MPFPTAAVVPSTSSWQQGVPQSGSDFPLPEPGIDVLAKPEPLGLNPATGKCELYDKAWHNQSHGNVAEHISVDRINAVWIFQTSYLNNYMMRKDFSRRSWPWHISTQQVSFTPTKQNQSKLKHKRSILQFLYLKHEILIYNNGHLHNLTLKRIVVPTMVFFCAVCPECMQWKVILFNEKEGSYETSIHSHSHQSAVTMLLKSSVT